MEGADTVSEPKPAKKKRLCILCHKNPPAVPDREQMGRQIKRVCSECHRNRLRADSERAMKAHAESYLARVREEKRNGTK